MEYNKCPNCGWHPKDDIEPTTADEYNKRNAWINFMDRKIKESAERMEKESGYGIPENKLTTNDPENLGSVITGEWRQYDNQKSK